ncbi:MAG: DoxX family protein [Luminiphilus sp.]|jgi:putative oxidoreductase|nr:DoxX family protein [Luminiphilus sp.]|tara:strand:+ start:214 stop:609 length:396 start_codon:yes stop_codon:yes gene_type:complete
MQSALMLSGRVLLALYFVLPGIAKFISWERHIALMETHEMVMVPILLTLAGLLQIAGGLLLLMNRHVVVCALGFAAMVLLINFNLHDFWNVYDGVNAERETQNFVKNLAVFAGLLVLAAAHMAPVGDTSRD